MKTLFEMIMFLKRQLSELTSLSSNYEAKIKLLVKKHKEDIKQERCLCESLITGLEDQLLKKKDELSKLHLEMKNQKVQLSAVIDKNTITEQYTEDSSLIKKLQKLLAAANEQVTSLTLEKEALTSQVAEFRHAFLDADEKCRDALFLNHVLTEESARAKEANDDLRKKMSDLTQTYLS
jgi:chromosome segregation ATPase